MLTFPKSLRASAPKVPSRHPSLRISRLARFSSPPAVQEEVAVRDLLAGPSPRRATDAVWDAVITATLQNLYHHLDQGLDAHDGAHHSRWHDQLSGEFRILSSRRSVADGALAGTTYFEWKDDSVGIAGYSNATVAYMATLGCVQGF